jgi:serine protease Do
MTNNPGAAGGALTDRQGRFVGLLGKELRNSQTNTWLNYAVPAAQLAPAVEDIRAGKTRPRSQGSGEKKPAEALTLALLGVGLVPDVLSKTPPFIDKIRPGSPAEKAGLMPDDLVLFVNNRIVPSCKTLVEEFTYIERGDEVKLTVQRGQDLIEVILRAESGK